VRVNSRLSPPSSHPHSDNNKHLYSLAQEKTFTNTLNFVSIDNISSINQHKLDRFRIYILPKIHQNVECFIVEPTSMECIFFATDYPNLTELKLFNFNQEIALNYFISNKNNRRMILNRIQLYALLFLI